jgi:hypothetical protein
LVARERKVKSCKCSGGTFATYPVPKTAIRINLQF